MKLKIENLNFLLQGMKFAVVGGANTGIDFLMVNLLFWFFRPSGQAGLLVISLVAACAAMANSYFMNKNWSFSARAGDASKRKAGGTEISSFLVVSLLGLAVNTSVFLFSSKYMGEIFGLTGFLNINISRLMGVVLAMCVTFLGYKFGVFDTKSVKKFRSEKADNWTAVFVPSYCFLASACVLALLVRLLFWQIAPVVYGDAVNYYWVARGLADGAYSNVDWFWHSLFTFFEAAIMVCGIGGRNALMLASLIPGILLLVPLYFASGVAFGTKPALLAVLFAVFSPRLIEYSVNGYSESFYLLCIFTVVSVAVLWKASGKSGVKSAVILGISAATAVLSRNEYILLVSLIFLLMAASRIEGRKLNLSIAFLCFVLVMSIYITANMRISGRSGLLQKSSNISKVYSEQIDWRNAARETYGTKQNKSNTMPDEGVGMRALRHFRENIFYMAERIPGVFMSPVVLFIPFAGLLGGLLFGCRSSALVFLICGIFPFVFYPFLNVEPRMIFLSLLVSIAWGAAGLWIFSKFIEENMGKKRMAFLFCATLIVAQVPFIPALAWRSRGLRMFHREIGEWLKENVATSDIICGDGYGYVLSSAFWASKKPLPRLWTDKPSEISDDMRDKNASILLLYEEFAKLANPEILPVFKAGIPGMMLVKEFNTVNGKVQVYRLNGEEK